MKRLFTALGILGAGFLVLWSCTSKDPGTPGVTIPRGISEIKSNSSKMAQEVKDMNNIILDLNLEEYVDKYDDKNEPYAHYEYNIKPFEAAVDKINAIAAAKPNSFAAQYYAAILKPVKALKCIVWRMGGFAVKSEFIYTSIVGSMHSIRHSVHLYSPAVEVLMSYIALPCKNTKIKRFANISNFQKFLSEKGGLLDLLEESVAALKALRDKGSNGTFIYDRALAARAVEVASEDDRYSVFINPYLTATLYYGELTLGFLKMLTQYKLDLFPEFLNFWFFETIKTKFYAKFDVFKKTGKVKVNTPRDFGNYLHNKFGKTDLLKREGDMTASQEALGHFQRAATYDRTFMEEVIKFPANDDYIMDHDELIHNVANDVGRLTTLEELWKAKDGIEITDNLTGKFYKLNITRLFDASLNVDLKHYYPIKFYVDKLKTSATKVNKRDSFLYVWGRSREWNDPSFNGFIQVKVGNSYEDIKTGKEFYEAHRALSYHDDVDALVNLILQYFM